MKEKWRLHHWKNCWFCINVDLLCARNECAVVNMWVVFLFAKMSPRQKEQEDKKNNSIHLCPFSLWPPDRPTDGLTDHWSPLRPERILRAQCFRVTCFTSEKDFWTIKKIRKERKKEKLRCHNKREKNSSNRRFTPHTHPVLHTYVYILCICTHTYTRKKLHP